VRIPRFWLFKHLEEETAYRLAGAARARIQCDELGVARGLLERARRLLNKASGLRPTSDEIRGLWALHELFCVRLDQRKNLNHTFTDWRIASIWKDVRASDTVAAGIFIELLQIEEKAGTLGTEWPRDESGGFQNDAASEDFTPSARALAMHVGGISRLGWRLLQFQAAAPSLRRSNPGDWAEATMKCF